MENETGKNIIITGGTSGLGRSLVNLFLEKGWNVSTLGRRSKELDMLKSQHPGDNFLAIPCDIRVESQVKNFFQQYRDRFHNVDVAILNAGTLGPAKLPEISNLDLIDLRMTFETNFFANFSVIKEILGLKAGNQTIVHITSDVVLGKYPGWGAYGASKAAMDFLVDTLEEESASVGLRTFTFDPGDMDTEMHRLALPDDKDLKDPAESARELYNIIAENTME